MTVGDCPLFHISTQERVKKEQHLHWQRSNQIFLVASCSAGALAVVFNMLRHSFVWDLFGEEEGFFFFKLDPQMFRNFDVHFCKPKPSSSFQPFCKQRRSLCRILILHNLFFNTKQVCQHRWQVERVGVVADDSLNRCCLIRVTPASWWRLNKGLHPPTHSFFYRCISLFARALPLSCLSIDNASSPLAGRLTASFKISIPLSV